MTVADVRKRERRQDAGGRPLEEGAPRTAGAPAARQIIEPVVVHARSSGFLTRVARPPRPRALRCQPQRPYVTATGVRNRDPGRGTPPGLTGGVAEARAIGV